MEKNQLHPSLAISHILAEGNQTTLMTPSFPYPAEDGILLIGKAVHFLILLARKQ